MTSFRRKPFYIYLLKSHGLDKCSKIWYNSSIMFKCRKCGIEKEFSEFGKDKSRLSGHHPYCKECRRALSRDRYDRDPERFKKQNMEYYLANKEKMSQTNLIYQKKKLKTDIFYRLSRNLRNRLWYALKNTEWKKNTKFTEYIGCDRHTLINHLENQFKKDMSWENYGKWDIDHIIPLSSAQTEEELYKLCHYTNLQPMWGTINRKKGGHKVRL